MIKERWYGRIDDRSTGSRHGGKASLRLPASGKNGLSGVR